MLLSPMRDINSSSRRNDLAHNRRNSLQCAVKIQTINVQAQMYKPELPALSCGDPFRLPANCFLFFIRTRPRSYFRHYQQISKKTVKIQLNDQLLLARFSSGIHQKKSNHPLEVIQVKLYHFSDITGQMINLQFS